MSQAIESLKNILRVDPITGAIGLETNNKMKWVAVGFSLSLVQKEMLKFQKFERTIPLTESIHKDEDIEVIASEFALVHGISTLLEPKQAPKPVVKKEFHIAITGHRPNKLGNDYDLTSPLLQNIKKEIISIIEQLQKPDREIVLVTGMALGIDTLFAKIAIEKKLRFIAAIPCTNQETMWPQKSQDVYHSLIYNPLCHRVFVSDKPYYNKCMQDRNEWMVHNSSILIAVWDGTYGGTANCVKYAESYKRKVLTINPNNHGPKESEN